MQEYWASAAGLVNHDKATNAEFHEIWITWRAQGSLQRMGNMGKITCTAYRLSAPYDRAESGIHASPRRPGRAGIVLELLGARCVQSDLVGPLRN